MFGNGLKAQIWESFCTRFNIGHIAEFYGATEGNCNMINIEDMPGCVGFMGVIWPQWVKHLFLPLFVIKLDNETGEPIRDSKGFCIKTDPGEPGEFIGKIVKGDPQKDFKGYKDESATKKKTLANVFKQGDLYFRSGDILVHDEFGNLTFKDRYGDTYRCVEQSVPYTEMSMNVGDFRWHGENVSTNEVEAIISSILDMKDATSYGVEIPSTDGRAGMVAIPASNENDIDLDKLQNGITEKLPKYARPLFVRLIKEVQITSKQNSQHLLS
jgi:solute carrier family 27 fatty acid transporter 1/4